MNVTYKHSAIRSLILLLASTLLFACSTPEEKAADYIESGYELMEEGNQVKASLQFRNALQINANLVEAIYGLALIHERRQEWREVLGLLTKIQELQPTYTKARIKLAQLYLASGQINLAMEDAKELLERLPNDARAHALMAAVQYRLENFDGAMLEVNKSLQIDPTNNDAQLVLARVYISQKKFEQAHEVIDKAIQTNSKSVSIYLMKIQAYEETNNLQGIETVYLMLIEKFPESLPYQLSLAHFYSDNKDIDKAETILSNIVAKNPDNVDEKLRLVGFAGQHRSSEQSIELLKDYIQQDNGESRYKFALGALYELDGKTSEAMAIYQGIIDAEELQTNALEARNKIALIELRAGNRDKTISLVGEVLAQDKNNENALLIQAGLKLADKQFDDAIVDLRTVLRDNPDSVKALSLLGKAYEATGSNELAVENYIKAYRGNAGIPAIANQLASYYLRNKKVAQADEVLVESLARGNRSQTALKLMVQAKLSLQEWGEAEKFAKMLQKIEGQEALSQQMLGFVYQGKQRQDDSIEAFKKAYELSPSSSQPVVALVRSYVRSGKLEEARGFLNSVLSVDAKNTTAYTMLGQLSLFEKQPEQAAKYFRKSVEVNPRQVIGYRSLARIYMADKQPAKVEKAIMDGLAALPGNPTLTMSLASFHESQKEFNKAIEIYEALLEKNPDILIAKNNLASLLTDHRTDKASLDKAREVAAEFKDSQIPHFRDTYAWAQINSDLQLEQAVNILEGVVKEVGQTAVFRYHLGKAYEKKGDSKNAREQLELAIEQGGKDSGYYDDAMSVIKSLK